MDPRMRADAIAEIAGRGDPALLKSFAYDMIVNANEAAEEAERERVLGIVAEQATRFSKEREDLVPTQMALVFANAVLVKARCDPKVTGVGNAGLKLRMTVEEEKVGFDPSILVYHVELFDGAGVWTELFGSKEQFEAFRKGLRAASGMMNFVLEENQKRREAPK